MFAARVELIPLADRRKNLFVFRSDATPLEFRMAAAGALVRRGVEINFQIGVGQHHRANVAPQHNHPPALGNGAHLGRENLAHPFVGRHLRNVGVHLGGANGPSDILAVQQHGALSAIVEVRRKHVNLHRLGQLRYGRFVGHGGAPQERRECDGAIHDAGVETQIIESAGQQRAHRGFAGGRRAVEGDDGRKHGGNDECGMRNDE